MHKIKKIFSLNVLLLVAVPISAHATVLTIGESVGNQFSSQIVPGGISISTFDNQQNGCSNTFGLPSNFIARDSVENVRLNPLGSCYVAVPRNGRAIFNFNRAFNFFGLFWGSIDTFNTLTFRQNGRTILTFSGTEAVLSLRLSQGFLNFFFPIDEPFTEVIASSSQNAFELDNLSVGAEAVSFPVASEPPYIPYPPRIPPRDPGFVGLSFNFAVEPAALDFTAQATPVNEPTALALFGAGIAGLGLLAGRRKRITH
jgi:hypothetical protein